MTFSDCNFLKTKFLAVTAYVIIFLQTILQNQRKLKTINVYTVLKKKNTSSKTIETI